MSWPGCSERARPAGRRAPDAGLPGFILDNRFFREYSGRSGRGLANGRTSDQFKRHGPFDGRRILRVIWRRMVLTRTCRAGPLSCPKIKASVPVVAPEFPDMSRV